MTTKGVVMEVLVDRCAGLDVHKKTVVACVRTPGSGRHKRVSEVRTFGTFEHQLGELRAWLIECGVTSVAMEATGVYWKPVWNMLEEEFEQILVNPRHLKSIPGKKTDFKDGDRIAELLQHGLLRGSFVPPKPIRELRDLTRMRATPAQERSSVINRIEKTLEDPNLKPGVVASDVVGASGRAMLNAIVKGETDAAKLAELAKGTLRKKIPRLKLALEGNITEHHRFMPRQWLEMLDFLDGKIGTLEEQIEEKSRPFEETVQSWTKAPGLKRINAYSLLAGIGADMKQFPSAGHLASWAAVLSGQPGKRGQAEEWENVPRKPVAAPHAVRSCLGGDPHQEVLLPRAVSTQGAEPREESGADRGGAQSIGYGVLFHDVRPALLRSWLGLLRTAQQAEPRTISGQAPGETWGITSHSNPCVPPLEGYLQGRRFSASGRTITGSG